MGSIRFGDAVFTATDAQRTVELFPLMWADLLRGRDHGVLTELRPTLTGDWQHDIGPVWEALLAAGPALRAAGQLPKTTTGSVVQVSRSSGGVPKTSCESVDVDAGGVVGDRQAARLHHGRPWQALCIWSTDVIDAFNAQGHRLFPGAAGENVTVRDLPWADVRAGVRLRLGSVVCDVMAFAVPCKKNASWFAGGNFQAMHHENGAVSRVYARVVTPGTIAPGDPAILEPGE